jgi:A/G-specific adenine glycosylase
MDASAAETIPRLLLSWYDRGARSFPWRAPPGSTAPEPYRVWLSEVMLQQTTTAHAARYFAEFTRRWPRVEDLAAAEDAEVMAAWAGLGYYARARNLLACARAVAGRGGDFPDSEAALRELPGIGGYTAAAVAAIAFGVRAVVVDANVERVVARLFAIADPLPRAKPLIHAATDRLTPVQRSGDFAQAMMDLGATVCTPKRPTCLVCPLSSHCAAYRSGEPDQYPVKAAKRAKPSRHGQAYWIIRDDVVWLVRRPPRGMLGGMRSLPDDGWSARADGSATGPVPGPWSPLGAVEHGFTHFDLRLQVVLYSGEDWASLTPDNGEWWPLDRIGEAGLPSLFGKAARLAMDHTGRKSQ